MENSLFGFNANLPPLEGRGLSPFLTADVDEEGDEYNALNDETFGAEAVEEDWESDHEKLAGLNIDYQPIPIDDIFQSKAYNLDNSADEIIQSSIKKLNLDDELDDPAIMSHSSSNSKKYTNHSVRSLYNHSPPPPAFIASDFKGSPMTEGIWSSPQRRDSAQTSSNLIDLSSLSATPVNHLNERKISTMERNRSPFGSINLPPVKILPNAKTVEELERDMFKNSHSVTNTSVMTLQDVEREIFLKPRVKTVSEIENELNDQVPPPTPGGVEVAEPQFSSQQPIGTPQSSHHTMNAKQQQMIRSLMMESPHVQMSPNIRHGQLPNQPRHPMYPQRFEMPVRHRHPMHPLNPNLRMMPPPMHNYNGYPVIPHPMLNNPPYPVGGPPMPPPLRYPPNNFQDSRVFMQQNLGFNMNVSNVHEPSGDPYAGLMTQKEKDWLIKIQMMQLQSDNPYVDDYYFMLYKMKKMKNEKKNNANGNNSCPKLVLPELGKADLKQYSPAQFQGSLGKIQAVSVNNPRKIIDTVEKNKEDDEEAKKLANKELRRFRKGLIDIEKLYDLILELDEIEKKMLALPPEAQVNLVEERNSVLSKLHVGLNINEKSDRMPFILSVRKGRRLLVRLFHLLNKDQQLQIFEAILGNLMAVIKRDQTDQVLLAMFPDIEQLLIKLNFEELAKLKSCVEFFPNSNNLKTKNNIPVVFQSRIGISILFSMLDRAEQLIVLGNVNSEILEEWSSFVKNVQNLLMMVPDGVLASPLNAFPNLRSHFQRFISDQSFQNDLFEKLSPIFSSN